MDENMGCSSDISVGTCSLLLYGCWAVLVIIGEIKVSDREKELREEIKRLDGEYSRVRQECLDRKKELAIYLCPFDIGDILVKKTYPFNCVEISNIIHSGFRCGYKLVVFKIKKDGGRYKYTSEIWSPEDYIKSNL